jgi:hypothetical protein
MTEDEIAQFDIGPGDDVFFVGRYVNHQGRQQNSPTVRLGIISMLPREKILHPRGTLVDSFLVEVRSLSGYSGSPVFLYRQPGSPRNWEWTGARQIPSNLCRSAAAAEGS